MIQLASYLADVAQQLSPTTQWAIVAVFTAGVGAVSLAVVRLYRAGNQQTVVTDASIAEFVTNAQKKIDDLEEEILDQREHNRRCERRFNLLLKVIQRTPGIVIPSDIEEELWRD